MDGTLNSLIVQRADRYRGLSDHPVLNQFVENFRSQFGEVIDLVMLYGSALRSQDYADGLLDFYVVLKSYPKSFFHGFAATVNSLLPPNVYYMRFERDGRVYQAKYATILTQQLAKRVSECSFHPYFWARFCQPMAVLYAADSSAYQQAIQIQEIAVTTFLRNSLRSIKKISSDTNLWETGFQLTYITELRAESSDRANIVYQYDAKVYDRLQAEFLKASSIHKRTQSSAMRIFNSYVWKLRGMWGKLVSVFRLMKAVFTFSNGVEYIIWKIERHNNTRIEVSQRVKDHPLIYAWPLLYRLWRSGMIR